MAIKAKFYGENRESMAERSKIERMAAPRSHGVDPRNTAAPSHDTSTTGVAADREEAGRTARMHRVFEKLRFAQSMS